MTAVLTQPTLHRRTTRQRACIVNLALLLYFAILTIALFGDLLTSSRAVVSAVDQDIDQQFFAWRSFAFGELKHGRLPLWNPYSFGGVPALPNFQYTVLYPPNWLHLVLPTGRALNVITALHVFFASAFGAMWCRWRGAGFVAAALGGTICALCGPYVLHVYAGHPPYYCAVTWTPLVFLAVDRALWRRGSGVATCALGAFAVAMQILASSPQPVYVVALAATAYVIACLIGRPMRRWTRPIACLVIMYGSGALLAAAQLLPALDVARESVRNQPLTFETAASYSLPPQNLLSLIAPYPFGDDFAVPYAGRWFLWETSLFVGPAAVVLAIVGVMWSRRRRDRAAMIVALLALLVALGSYTPLFKLLYPVISGLSRFRGPARFAAVAMPLIAVLAAHGLELLLRHKDVRARAARVAVAALVIATLLACGAVFVKARPGTWAALLENRANITRSAAQASSQLMWAAAVLAQAAIVLLLARRVRWLPYALAILVIADLTAPGGRAIQRFYPQLDAPPAWRDTIASLAPDDRVLTIDGPHANLATQLAIEDAWGYDPAMPGRWGDLVGRLIGADPRAGDFTVRKVEPSPLWSMLRVRETLPPTPSFATEPPMPRVLIVDDATVVDGPAASLAAVFEPSFDPRQRVILESAPNPVPRSGASGSAHVTRRDLGCLEITADVTAPAILLITDAYSGGWTVRSKSAPAHYDLLSANHALRAIPLEAGHHELIVEYAPRSVTIGFWVSAVVWIAFFVIVLTLAARRLAARWRRT